MALFYLQHDSVTFVYKTKGVILNQQFWLSVSVAVFSVLNMLLFYFGIDKTTANSAVIIYSAVPLVAAILAHYWIKEKLTFIKLAGLIMGFVGVSIIVLLPLYFTEQTLYGDFTGNHLIAVAVFVWSLYTVGSRLVLTQKLITPLNPTFVSVVLNLLTFILLIVPQQILVITPQMTLHIWVLLFYLAIFVTIFALLLFQFALQHLSSAVVSIKQYLELLLAIWFNLLLVGEKLTRGYVLGSILILFGVYLVTKSNIK